MCLKIYIFYVVVISQEFLFYLMICQILLIITLCHIDQNFWSDFYFSQAGQSVIHVDIFK